jgi:hypothetical protein
MNWIIATFWTPNYAPLSVEFMGDIDRLQLPVRAEAIPKMGSYPAQMRKATYILETMDTYGLPVIWVDIDARIRRWPDLFDSLAETADLSAYRTSAISDRPDRRTRLYGLNTSTIFINMTEPGRKFLQAWAHHCLKPGYKMDQEAACGALLQYRPPRCVDLPQGYAKIFDRKWQPGEEQTIYIEQFQASRRKL